jgi:hypothetical protein
MSRMMRNARDPEGEGSARRLLTRLNADGCVLRNVNGCYRLLSQGAAPSMRQDVPVQGRLVTLCLQRDWLERKDQDLVLSAAGRAWLRRCEAGGDAFREQHQVRTTQLKEVEGTRRPVLLNETESPLGWLKSRKDRNGRPLITEHQYEAGQRLRADYWFAHLSPGSRRTGPRSRRRTDRVARLPPMPLPCATTSLPPRSA